MNFTIPGDCINLTTSSIWKLSNIEICMLCINLMFALPAHSYVIWLIMTGAGSGVASEFFILNLSVCEIGNCLDSLLFIKSHWILGLDKLSQFLQGLAFTGRPLFQCLMCVERYLAVIHPVIFLKFKPFRYRVICCTVAWIITLGSCLSFMVMLMFSTINMHAWFLLQFLLFLSIQLFCLVAVLRALKQSGPGERGGERGENQMKRRAFHLILITTVTTMLIIYVPYNIITLLNTLTHLNIPKLWFIVMICYLLASFVQPVLYLHRSGKLSCLCEILHCPI